MSEDRAEALATDLLDYRRRLTCSFEQIDAVFVDCMAEARKRLSDDGIEKYLEGASLVCMIGRGVEPVLIYLEEMPAVATRLGEEALELVSQTVWKLSRTPNGKAIPAFMQSLGEAARRLASQDLLQRYFALVFDLMERTTGSIHGFHQTMPSPALPKFLLQAPFLLNTLSLEGIRNWIDYGVRFAGNRPDRLEAYFSLQSADSKAILQRERKGTLFADNERKMDLYLKAVWDLSDHFAPYSEGFSELRRPMPYFDKLGIRLPDVYEDKNGIKGTDRYRALLAHIAAHKRWTTPVVADNYSPFQRVTIEMFEDCRVEALTLKRYPGMRKIWLGLHPKPGEDDCNPEVESCIRHRLAMFSYAVLDPNHGYTNPVLRDFVDQFHALLAEGDASTKEAAALALSFAARTRRQEDQSANVYFADTEIDYRDDNRHMWRFIEEGDEEESFDDQERKAKRDEDEDKGLPPRHYPEWDYQTQLYHPDYVSLYENLHPSGEAAVIDGLLEKNAALANRLKQLLDMLKPQEYERVRYQEEGSELDLDVAIRSLIDFRSGAQPDPRINMSHRTAGRNLAVSLVIDLSQSVGEVAPGCDQTVLEISREAVALLGWAIDPARRFVRHRRVLVQLPPRGALPAHQGLCGDMERRGEGTAGGHGGGLLDPHGRGDAPCRALPEGPADRQEADADPHRRRAARRRRHRRPLADRRRPQGGARARP